MKISRTQVEKITVTEVPNLDPLSVYLEDYGPGQGKITITCFGKSWTHYWSHMGEDTKLREFFLSCDNQYIAGKLAPGTVGGIDAPELLPPILKAKILELRREGSLAKLQARDLYVWADDLRHDPFDQYSSRDRDNIEEIFGPEWWYEMPSKPNPDYEYLCRILDAVKEALRCLE